MALNNRLKFLSILTLMTLLLSLFEQAFASSCMPMTVDEAYERSDYVFEGVAIKVEFTEPRDPPLMRNASQEYIIEKGCGEKRVTFKINKQWKGKEREEITVLSGNGCVGLGGYFDEEKKYIIFANLWNANLLTSVCNRSKLIEGSEYFEKEYKKDIEYLNGINFR